MHRVTISSFLFFFSCGQKTYWCVRVCWRVGRTSVPRVDGTHGITSGARSEGSAPGEDWPPIDPWVQWLGLPLAVQYLRAAIRGHLRFKHLSLRVILVYVGSELEPHKNQQESSDGDKDQEVKPSKYSKMGSLIASDFIRQGKKVSECFFFFGLSNDSLITFKQEHLCTTVKIS